MRSTDQRLAVTDERWPHDTCIVQLAADIDPYVRARRGRHACQGDRALQGRGKGAAGDLALASIGQHLLMRAQDAAPFEQQAYELALRAARANGLEGLATDECPLTGVQGHRPAEAGFKRVRGLIHVAAVKVHAGLEAQGVARAET